MNSTPVFNKFRFDRSFVFCVVFCRLLFVVFLLTILLSVPLRLTNSGYPFGTQNHNIFKSWVKDLLTEKMNHNNRDEICLLAILLEISKIVIFITGTCDGQDPMMPPLFFLLFHFLKCLIVKKLHYSLLF